MKKIGFVDYYISEWHANKYPAWIKEINDQNGTDFELAYVFAELDTSPVDQKTTAEWCSEYGVAQCTSLEELCEKSDCIIILAPTNPEKHLPYAKVVLPYGKPTYIDKSFATNLREAEEIMEIAQKHHTPFFSTSALRYASELCEAPTVKNLIVTGSGTSMDEYIIHHVEMAVMLLNDLVVSAKVIALGKQRVVHLSTETGKKAALIFANRMPYSLTIETPDGSSWNKTISSSFFKGLIADILHLFETGTASYDIKQLREVMKVRDMILEAEAEGVNE